MVVVGGAVVVVGETAVVVLEVAFWGDSEVVEVAVVPGCRLVTVVDELEVDVTVLDGAVVGPTVVTAGSG